MFVLSGEGQAFLNKGTWSTHKILGVFSTFEEAEKALPGTPVSRTEEAQMGSALYFISDSMSGEMFNMSDGE